MICLLIWWRLVSLNHGLNGLMDFADFLTFKNNWDDKILDYGIFCIE